MVDEPVEKIIREAMACGVWPVEVNLSYFHFTSHFLKTYKIAYNNGPELPFGLIFGYVTPREG